MKNNDLQQKALNLVRERITGTRKGCDEPASEHSIRVADTLKKYGYPNEVVIAGILHDIIEDGDMTGSELLNLGFSESTVSLVETCSHDATMQNKDARWVKMIAHLIDLNDKDAWAVKCADLLDNCRSCHTMPLERATFIRTVKAPLFLSVTKHVLGDSDIRNELREEVKNSIAV